MSDVIEQLMNRHHSVRKFKQEPLSKETVKQLVQAGQSASTSSYLQTYSALILRLKKRCVKFLDKLM